jgi:hypothetical protein
MTATTVGDGKSSFYYYIAVLVNYRKNGVEIGQYKKINFAFFTTLWESLLE